MPMVLLPRIVTKEQAAAVRRLLFRRPCSSRRSAIIDNARFSAPWTGNGRDKRHLHTP